MGAGGMGWKGWALVAVGFAVTAPAPAVLAGDLRGPRLAAASNFGQGMSQGMLDAAIRLGVRDLRDALYWDRVEQGDGGFVYDRPTTTYPDALPPSGAQMSLTVNNGHPAYEDGATPLGDVAVKAFGRHAAHVAARFPAITGVEVGNEFNGQNFVTGPLLDQGLGARAKGYVALLRSVYEQTKAVRPDVRIIGGGVHSIPTGYIREMLALGAADWMDAIAVHPYSTPIDQLARQIAVLRDVPGLADMPVEITEFGSKSAGAAANDFVRGYCQMALSGVTRLAWYPLNDRGDGYVPLIAPDLGVTSAGQAYGFVLTQLEGRVVRDASPDDFTYACLFQDRILVIWGMARDVSVARDRVEVRSATGQVLDGARFRLSETAPLILMARDGALRDGDYALAAQTVLADSFHQFAYPADARGSDPSTPAPVSTPTPGPARAMPAAQGFERGYRVDGEVSALITMPGQGGPGRPWTPWLGIPGDPGVRVLSDTLVTGGNDPRGEIVHTYMAPQDMRVAINARFAPAERSLDGITVTIRRNDTALIQVPVKHDFTYDKAGVHLRKGDVLEFGVSAGATTTGDVTAYRITLTQVP